MKRNGCGGVRVEAGRESLISSAGAALLLQTGQVSGLTAGLSQGLSPWRAGRSVHDPGKMVLDLAVSIALGGDCLADAAVVRAQPELFGAVASDPTISRLVEALGRDARAAVAAIRRARAGARARVWGHRCPVSTDAPVIVDLDATLVGAHSEKEGATATFKRGFGFHPMLAFVDHGGGGTGEPLAAKLRPGKANANDAGDQIAVLDAALAQLPEPVHPGCWCVEIPAPGSRNSSGTSTIWGCSTRWECMADNLFWTRWAHYRSSRGDAPWTPTASPATEPRSPS